MQITIRKIVILTNLPGTDRVTIYTDMPSPYPKVTDEKLSLNFDVEHGKGIEYAKKNFADKNIIFEEINTETGKRQQL